MNILENIKKDNYKKVKEIALPIWIDFVFIQSLVFKFSGAPETKYIFTTISNWMEQNMFSFAASFFQGPGAYVVGFVELIAAIMLLFSKTRIYGAITSFFVIVGALFFHLFSPLGINVQNDSGTLFIMAISVFVASLVIIYQQIMKK